MLIADSIQHMKKFYLGDFRVPAAFFVRGALSRPHTSRAPGFACQKHAQARDSDAAQGNAQGMEATLATLFRNES